MTYQNHPRMHRIQIGISALSLLLALTIAGGMKMAQAQTNPSVQTGYTLLERGWVNDAIATFRQVLQQSPQSVEAQLGLAIAYQRAGEDEAAWQAYQQVLALDPDQRQALTAVGLLGGYRPAWQAQGIAALSRLLVLDPENLEARSQRALLLGYQGRFAEAILDYEQLLPQDPNPETVLNAAQVYTYSGDYSQGLMLFDRYQAMGQSLSDEAITAYALALRETGQVPEAIALLQSRLNALGTLNDTTIPMRSVLAVAYQMNQQPDRALQVLEPLRGWSDAELPLARALSAIARQSGEMTRYQEAIALYRRVLAATDNPSPGFKVEVADVMSEVDAFNDEALELYEQAAQELPDDLSVQVKRLVLATELGQQTPTELIRQLQARLDPLPSNRTLLRSLAQTLVRLDPPPLALQAVYEQLGEADLDLPLLSFRIAQIRVQQQDWAGAKQALEAYRAIATDTQAEVAANFLLADIERQEGNLDASAQRYEAVLAQTPDQIDALSALGGVRFEQRRYAEAERLFAQVLALNPDHIETRRILAELSLVQGRPLDALTQLQALQSRQPEPDPALTRRIQTLRVDLLRRRGLQPYWERY